jgi:G3E family GTPase
MAPTRIPPQPTPIAVDTRIAVHLITGLAGEAKRRLLSGWLAARPPGERWGVLVDGLPGDLQQELVSAHSHAEADQNLLVMGLMGGCACCVGGPAFTASLTRLLRQGPWDRLFIEVSPQAQGSALVDRLRAPPLAAQLWVAPVTLVVDLHISLPYMDKSRSGYSQSQENLALARCVVISRAHQAEVLDEVPGALLAHLSQASPWPRRVQVSADGTVPLSWLDSTDVDPPDALADPQACELRWPPECCFDRRQLREVLSGLSAHAQAQGVGLLEVRGVFRTARAWYAWQQRGDAVDWRETAWRHDSRLAVLADGPRAPTLLQERLQSAIAPEDAGGQ